MKLELNDKEKKLIKAFPGVGNPASLADLAKDAFPSMGARSTTKGNSWVRNSLRKPIKLKLVKQLGRGTYVLLKNPLEKPKKTSPRRGKKTPTRSASKMNGSRAARTRKSSAAKISPVSNGTPIVTTTTRSGATEATAV